jgi:hypothetical protein
MEASRTVTKIAPYAKSIVAALIAALASLQQALDADNHVSASEWVAVVMALLVAGGAVFAVPNRDPQAAHQDESVQPPEAGESAVLLAVVVALAVLIVLFLFGAIR